MKHFYIIIFLSIMIGCKNNTDIDYVKIDSKNIIKTFEEIDASSGKIINVDTFPYYMPSLIKDSKRRIDTTRILLPTAKTAMYFARLILDSTYGKKHMIKDEPFHVGLIDNKYWYIIGSKKSQGFGGWPEIIISKYDGKVIYLTHYK